MDNIRDLRAQGIGELLVKLRQNYQKPLSENTLKYWHKLLFTGTKHISVGEWRSGDVPMQVISDRADKPKVHFEAPPSHRIPDEIKKFLKWFNNSSPNGKKPIKHPAIRSAIAHIYFESIHPFEDGNGRIGRAISDKALCQSCNYPLSISISTSIEAKKNDYYNALEKAQRSNEITQWLIYFIETLIEAQSKSEELIHFTLKKTKFFDRFSSDLNPRQSKIIKKMFAKGVKGFTGGMSAKKYMSITKTSKATATRDLVFLEKIKALKVHGKGRNTRYSINFDEL